MVNRYGLKMGLAGETPGSRRYGETAQRGAYERAGTRKKEDGMKQSQKLLLTWLIEYPVLFTKIGKYISPEDFTEEIYHKVAELLFAQYKESGAVNPAQIVSMFADEEEQREIAGLFNARIHRVETKDDMDKALKETIVRVKKNSIDHRTLAPDDLQGLMKIVEDKKMLEALEKTHISIDL